MEIKRTQQTLDIKKVEEDKSSEVKKTKPLGQSQTPDSFELGRSRTDQNSSSASSSESPKQADQITNTILESRLSAARLEQSGIRKRTEEKPITGKRELGTDEQNAADTKGPDVPDQNAGMDTGTSSGPRVPAGAFTGDARSRIDEANQALRDLVAKSGKDLNPELTGERPRGGPSSQFDSGSVGDAFRGGPTGPSNPMDTVNKNYDQALKNAGMNSQQNITEQMRAEFASGDQGPTKGYGKDMIATPAAGTGAPAEKPEEKAVRTVNEVNDFLKNMDNLHRPGSPGGAPQVPQPVDAHGKPIKTEEEKAKEAKEAKGGKPAGATDQTQEAYEREKWEEMQEKAKEALGDIGIDRFARPTRPIIQGDIDPAEDQQKGGGTDQRGPTRQQLLKNGLINPGSADANGPSGGAVNLGQRGGDIDFENGSGYMGSNRTNDPQDVDVSGAPMGQLNVVSRDQKEDEDDENKTSTKKKR